MGYQACTVFAPIREVIHNTDNQVEKQLRPINNWINEARVSATPEILSILRDYGLTQIEFVEPE